MSEIWRKRQEKRKERRKNREEWGTEMNRVHCIVVLQFSPNATILFLGTFSHILNNGP